jgi:hypothetical protein
MQLLQPRTFGIIYYSLKEAHDHIAAPGDEIDQLGQSDY